MEQIWYPSGSGNAGQTVQGHPQLKQTQAGKLQNHYHQKRKKETTNHELASYGEVGSKP